VQKLMEQMKKGGRMQTYMVVMVAYFGYNAFNSYKNGGTGSKDSQQQQPMGSGADPTADDDGTGGAAAPAGRVSRRFKELDGQWLSYMQSDSKAETLMLMLHRTSSSAEVEFSTAFPGLTKAVGANARIIAPDRPCHGFSPCPAGGESQDGHPWLSKLMRSSGNIEKIALVAVGREAAAQALALAGRRREVQNILLLSPKVVAPPRGKMTKAEELQAWLVKHKYPATGQAAADAIRWAAAGSDNEAEQSLDKMKLNIDKLTQDCRVTILYDSADEEDEELRAALDAQGTEVKTRSPTGGETLVDILTDEVQTALMPQDASGVDMEN